MSVNNLQFLLLNYLVPDRKVIFGRERFKLLLFSDLDVKFWISVRRVFSFFSAPAFRYWRFRIVYRLRPALSFKQSSSYSSLREVLMRDFEPFRWKSGEASIAEIQLDPTSRDDIPQLLRGLQHLYMTDAL